MGTYKQHSHVVWQCSYHIVWCPKYRFRVLTGLVKDLVEHDIKMLCQWKSCEVEELSVQPDDIHMNVSIPPKVSVYDLIGLLKGKLAIKLFKSYPQLKQKPYLGNHFWSHGYFVNTIGLNEDLIRRYVLHQEDEDKKEESNGKHFTLFG
jgi:putative transposase